MALQDACIMIGKVRALGMDWIGCRVGTWQAMAMGNRVVSAHGTRPDHPHPTSYILVREDQHELISQQEQLEFKIPTDTPI